MVCLVSDPGLDLFLFQACLFIMFSVAGFCLLLVLVLVLVLVMIMVLILILILYLIMVLVLVVIVLVLVMALLLFKTQKAIAFSARLCLLPVLFDSSELL